MIDNPKKPKPNLSKKISDVSNASTTINNLTGIADTFSDHHLKEGIKHVGKKIGKKFGS